MDSRGNATGTDEPSHAGKAYQGTVHSPRHMGLLRELRYEVSTLVFGLGILGTFLSLTHYYFKSGSPDWLRSVQDAVGPNIFWVGVLGVFALLIGGWYFVDTIRKDREFGRLLATNSKEIFVKNLKRMEELAYYDLPSAYAKRLEEKKREFRVKS